MFYVFCGPQLGADQNAYLIIIPPGKSVINCVSTFVKRCALVVYTIYTNRDAFELLAGGQTHSKITLGGEYARRVRLLHLLCATAQCGVDLLMREGALFCMCAPEYARGRVMMMLIYDLNAKP